MNITPGLPGNLLPQIRGGVRTEKLWFNFAPSAVHWTTYAGDGFIDRQRIKRKAARWAVMFGKLPPGERLAVLAALIP